jgi:hypothetical protein
MIHYTPEGHPMKIGLNFHLASGGFCLIWAWYDFATNKAIAHRLRVRLHMAPRIIWETMSWNVIDSYLVANDFEVVLREVLNDLKSTEEFHKKRYDHFSYINPQ